MNTTQYKITLSESWNREVIHVDADRVTFWSGGIEIIDPDGDRWSLRDFEIDSATRVVI